MAEPEKEVVVVVVEKKQEEKKEKEEEKKTPKKEADGEDEEENGADPENDEIEIEGTPLLVNEIKVVTGEEDEETLYKWFCFSSTLPINSRVLFSLFLSFPL